MFQDHKILEDILLTGGQEEPDDSEKDKYKAAVGRDLDAGAWDRLIASPDDCYDFANGQYGRCRTESVQPLHRGVSDRWLDSVCRLPVEQAVD